MKIETVHPKTGSEAEIEKMSKKRKVRNFLFYDFLKFTLYFQLESVLEDASCSFKIPKLSTTSQGSCTDNVNNVVTSESPEKSKKEKQLEASLK